jgi:dihydroorotase-like cyclic amidohydrolase
VNSPAAAIALAIARTADGSFAIPALGTDGGGIPRNTTLEQGLALVCFGALSLADLVTKACVNPAQMLGLPTKGHLGTGADADLIVVDPLTGRAEWVLANGQVAGAGGC